MGRRNFVVLDHVPSNANYDGNATMRLSQNLSAYEVTTAKIIKDESELQERDQICTKVDVFCAFRNNWLIMSVDSDIHVFDMSMGCTEFVPDNSRSRLGQPKNDTEYKMTMVTPDDGKVVAIRFLPSCDILMILLSTGKLIFTTPTSRFLHKMSILPPIDDCSMHIITTDQHIHTACILDRHKSLLYFLTIPEFTANIREEEAFQNFFSSVKLECTVETKSSGAHFLTSIADSFVCFPRRKGELVTNTSIYPEYADMLSEMFTLRENINQVQTVGCFVVALIPSGKLIFFDQNLIQSHVMTLFKEDEQVEEVLDFEFLDVDNFTGPPKSAKILFKVKTKCGIQFKIKQFNEADTEFSTDCSQHAILIPLTTPDDDSNIVYVDPFPAKSPDSILIRFVSEAQPLIRLNKMLDFKRFDSALNFAKNHNLPLDLVFAAVVRDCQEQIQTTLEDGDYDDELFLKMMRNLQQLSDNNNAGDLCVAALPFLNSYRHIKDILEFSNKLTITDEYTNAEIARIHYELASYRMVYGSEDTQYGPKSMWRAFFSSETHKEFFDHFCEEGKISEARILFSRYIDIPQNLTGKEVIQKVLSVFKHTIIADPTLCPPISEFIQSDLVPVFLYSGYNPKEISLDLCDFFLIISMLLEEIQPATFPQNALNFAQTFSRAIQFLKKECRTTDQYVAFSLILKELDTEEGSTDSPIAKLNTLIRNLTKLVKIHTTYQCPMPYSEYITLDVHSICYRILDRIRAAQSVKQHIEQFVFPYIEEHRLDRNEMLHDYIKELASAYRYGASSQHSTTWDVLCLQITEQITDINMRCRAIIEIASGTPPPWNQQLSSVVKRTFSQGDKIDPKLISKLRQQCLYADLGQVFIAYQIPLNVRSRIIGNSGIQSLLQFLFKNSDKEMAVKVQDAVKIVEIYGSLLSIQSPTSIDCYIIYSKVLIKQFINEWDIKPLLDLFQLIKSKEEVEVVATKLILYIKQLLEPTVVKKVISQRLIWLSCFLCVIERFLPDNSSNKDLIRRARNIRELQIRHEIIAGFQTFRDKNKCIEMLEKFIEAPNEKSIIEITSFGNLLSMGIKETCTALLSIQIRRKLPEGVLKTLSFLLSNENSPTKEHLENALEACTYVCWEFTEMVKHEGNNWNKIDSCREIIELFKLVLPSLIDWSLRLERVHYVEAFSNISRYVTLFSLILQQYANEDEVTKTSIDQPKPSTKFYTTRARMGIMIPQQEGTMFDSVAIVKAITVVASSIVEPPVGEEFREEFNEQMRESWERLFVLLSGFHVLLEIQARQLANTLPCFNLNEKTVTNSLMGMDRHATELCKKILSVPIADLQLSAHLLFSLSNDEMKKTLNELRQWTTQKKNVRFTLNLIHASIFVLILVSQEGSIIKQVASWYELTRWQKRLFKQGMNIGSNQLRRESIFDLAPDFAKILISSATLKEYCEEFKIDTSSVLLNYGVELCKYSSSLANDHDRFSLCIETAKAAIQEANADEKTVFILNQTIQELCPYNYEAIELLLIKLQELQAIGVLTGENANYVRINDCFTLIQFLKIYNRQGSITPTEIRWHKEFVHPRYYDVSILSKSGQIETFDETGAGLSENTMIQGQQQAAVVQYSQRNDALLNESNLPKPARKRLPFHIFLLEEKEVIDKYQTPFLYNELTIHNVQHWISLVEGTKAILLHSRTNLLVGAINSHVREIVKYKRSMDGDDLKQIQSLIYDSHNRLSILKGLASRFQRLPLGVTKIALIELCCDVAEKWIHNFEELEIPAKDRDSYAQSRAMLRHLLAVLNTEHLLETNALLNADTATLTQKPDELINHLLCDSKIDWTDLDCVVEYFGMVDRISKIHGVELEEIFDQLINRWIPGNIDQSDEGVVQVSADPDSTIDFMGSSAPKVAVDGADSEFSLPILYDDPQTTRIILLLKRIKDPFGKIVEIFRKYNQDVSIVRGGYMTKIRIATCLLRFLDDAHMQKLLFAGGLSQFGCDFINLLNQRLYHICRIEIPSSELQDSDKKLDFIRTILSPQSIYRQTQEMAHLLLCLVIDNDIDDLNLLGKVAQRLLQLKLSRQLVELLKYIRNIGNKDIKCIPNLATYFGRAFESLFAKLDCANERYELLTLVHFLISCPVEGGNQFMRAESLLNAANAHYAASLVAIASNAIADISISQPKEGSATVDCDVKFAGKMT